MQTICAFGKTSLGSGATIFDNLTAKTDVFFATNQAGQFYLGSQQAQLSNNWRIEWGYACGTTMSVARVLSGYMQRFGFPSVAPINPGLTIPSAFEVAMFNGRGPKLTTADAFNVQADSTAAEVQTAFLGITDGNMNIPVGEIFPLGFTTTITTVANAWTAGSMSLVQNLPPGKWNCIGGDLLGTTLMGWRLVPFTGGARPGALGRAANTIFSPNQFRNGNLGSWCEFDSYALPSIEVFASSAAAITFTGVLDMVKVGGANI